MINDKCLMVMKYNDTNVWNNEMACNISCNINVWEISSNGV